MGWGFRGWMIEALWEPTDCIKNSVAIKMENVNFWETKVAYSPCQRFDRCRSKKFIGYLREAILLDCCQNRRAVDSWINERCVVWAAYDEKDMKRPSSCNSAPRLSTRSCN